MGCHQAPIWCALSSLFAFPIHFEVPRLLSSTEFLQTPHATPTPFVGISTAALGVVLVLVGRARLAKFVSYLPMPVIGGYLAFIGAVEVEWGGLGLAGLCVISSSFSPGT